MTVWKKAIDSTRSNVAATVLKGVKQNMSDLC